MIGLLGIVVILGLAWALSIDRRRALNPRIFAWGLGLPIVMALVTLRTPIGARFFITANDAADAFIGFANKGISLVFGQWTETMELSAPLPDGSIAKVNIDFATLRELSAAAREYGMGGAVQHGASTLPAEPPPTITKS